MDINIYFEKGDVVEALTAWKSLNCGYSLADFINKVHNCLEGKFQEISSGIDGPYITMYSLLGDVPGFLENCKVRKVVLRDQVLHADGIKLQISEKVEAVRLVYKPGMVQVTIKAENLEELRKLYKSIIGGEVIQ